MRPATEDRRASREVGERTAPDEGATAEDDGRTDSESGDRVADDRSVEAGRLLLIPPEGSPRELADSRMTREASRERLSADVEHGADVEHDAERAGSGFDDADRTNPEFDDTDRTCSKCNGTRSVTTVVREHTACGQVSFDGFLGADGGFACPKCGHETDRGYATDGGRDEDPHEFTIVATIQCCTNCGRPVDRPLGRGGR